jgi:hypothetical protein
MKVTTWHGSGIYGIRVGSVNRDRYFNCSWVEIKVEMDGQCHTFQLTNGFWHKCPEFRDRVGSPIKSWLQKHRTLNWPPRQTPKMKLIPLSRNNFRLVT